MPVAAAPMDGTEPASREDPMSAATRTTPPPRTAPGRRRAGTPSPRGRRSSSRLAFSQASSTRSQATPVWPGRRRPLTTTAGAPRHLRQRQELIIRGSNGGGLNCPDRTPPGIAVPATRRPAMARSSLTLDGLAPAHGLPYPAAGNGQELIIAARTAALLHGHPVPGARQRPRRWSERDPPRAVTTKSASHAPAQSNLHGLRPKRRPDRDGASPCPCPTGCRRWSRAPGYSA